MRLLCLFSFVVLMGCKPFDEKADRARLLVLHQEARESHFSKTAAVMVEGFSENFVSINHGEIDSVTSREEYARRFQEYFDAVEFKKWDDVAEPTIRFSEDHTMAYMIVDKLVVLETKDSVGTGKEATTHFAWVAIYKKQTDGDWKLECIASTNQPETIKPL